MKSRVQSQFEIVLYKSYTEEDRATVANNVRLYYLLEVFGRIQFEEPLALIGTLITLPHNNQPHL